mmetsp:Transcript_25499/g.101623  ORF Transcript_25499/g.101623 Transcript_25499/m.101623 type:complete len:496 (-) Transcript_25499:788-2275(-)
MSERECIRMEGVMHKKGGMRWQKRYFVLQQSGSRPAVLAYFKDENTENCVARASLELTSDAKVDVLLGKQHAFQVIIKGRALKVAAESHAERDKWMKCLRDCISIAISQTIIHFSGTDWFVDPKYRLVRKVGSGAYGFVVAADDLSANKQVAIKKVANAFDDMVDAKRILREVRLMRQFSHPNVVKLYDIMEPPYIDDFEDLYIVTELMSTDLQKILYSKTTLSDEQLQYLLYQLLAGMNYINSASVLHRDLKPSNLLIDIQTCNLQICDFGLARGVAGHKGIPEDEGSANSCDLKVKHEEHEYTEYVVTRWYRAPEIMLGYHAYDQAIDMWSIGCIFGEMLLQQPVFPGSDYIHQLKLIVKLLGRPDECDLWFVCNQNAMNFMLQLPCYKAQDLQTKFSCARADALDLLALMLVFDPQKRVSLHKAMEHKFVEEFREHELEQDAGFHVKIDDVEQVKLTKKSLQTMLYSEIRAFHRHTPVDHGQDDCHDMKLDK